MRTFKINSLNNFQMFDAILTIITMMDIRSRTYLFYNWEFVPIDRFHSFPSLSTSQVGNPQFVL